MSLIYLSQKDLFDIADSIFLTLDTDFKITMMNRKGCELLGDEENELLGKNWFDCFFQKKTAKELKLVYQNYIENKIEFENSIVEQIVTKNGSYKTISWMSKFIKNDKGNTIGLYCTGNDITEQKKLEQTVEKVTKEYNTLFEITGTAIGVVNKEGIYTEVNSQFERITGFTKGEIAGRKHWKEFIPKNEYSHVEEIKYSLKRDTISTPKQYETKIITKNNEIRNVIVNIEIIQEQKKMIVAYIDITELKKKEQLVKEKEENYKRLIEVIPDAIILSDLDGNTIYANNNAVTIYNYNNLADFEKQNIRGLISEDCRDRYESDMNKTLLKEEMDYNEYIMLKKDGTKFSLEVKHKLITDMNGNPIAVMTIGRDVTERKKLEKELRENERLANAILDNSLQLTGLLLPQGNVMNVNKTSLDLVGVKKEDVIGKPFWETTWWSHSEEEQSKIKEFVKKTANGDTIRKETTVIDSENRIRNISFSLKPLLNEDGKIIYLIYEGHDITERKKLESEQRKSENRMRNLVENIPIAISILSHEFKLIDINSAYWKLFGYISKEEFLKSNKTDFWIDINGRRKFFEIIQQRKFIKNFETKLQRSDGSIIWGSISTISFKDSSGETTYFQIIQDVTTKKELEKQLKLQVLKYKIEEAQLYMIEEEIALTSKEVFQDLLKVGYKGLIFSRSIENHWREDINNNFVFYKLAEKGKGNIIPPDFSKLEEIIEGLPNRSVIFIDRLDYLIQKNGFEATLFFIYKLMDIVFLSNNIILISVDSSILNLQEKKLLEKELKQLDIHGKKALSEDLLELLKYIYQNNISGSKPTISEIIKNLRISRPTARKRILKLIEKDYLTESTSGRNKIIQTTLKGNSIF